MRLLTSTVYRAFPELDSYDVPHCERFLARARGGGGSKAACALAMLVAAFSTFGVLLVGILKVSIKFWPHPSVGGPGDVGMVLAIVVASVSGPLMALFVRDRVLHSRIRYILRIQGVCGGCGYSLIGLSLDVHNNVRCPECDQANEVDPAMAELVVQGEIRTVAAVHDQTPKRKPFFSARSMRTALRWAGGASVTIVILALLALGINEVRVRIVVAQALAIPSATPAMNNYVATLGTGGTSLNIKGVRPAQGVFWEQLYAIDKTFGRIAKEVTAAEVYGLRASLKDGVETALDPADISPDGTGWIIQFQILPQDVSKIHEATQAGHFKQLDAVMAIERKERTQENGYRENPSYLFSSVDNVSSSMSAIIERARLTVVEQRAPEFLDALRTGFAIAHLFQSFPTVMSYWWGAQYELWIHDVVGAALSSPMRNEILDDLAALYAQEVPNFPMSHPWRGIALGAAKNAVPWFSDPALVRFGSISATGGIVRNVADQGVVKTWQMYTNSSQRLGSLDENISAFEVALAEYEAAAALPVSSRIVPAGLGMSEFLPLRYHAVMMSHTLTQLDKRREQRAGIAAWIAVERYRARTGKLPASLADLVGHELTTLPTDPISGKPFGYKTTSRGGYLVYGLGSNGIDDGGQCTASMKTPQLVARWNAESWNANTIGTTLDDAINITKLIKVMDVTPSPPQTPKPGFGDTPLQ